MRTLQQFTEDMKDYDVTSEKAGVDPEATFQLGEDVDTYLRLQKEHSVSDESIAFCRSVLASRLTRMDENFEPGRMARIGGSSEIGLGETYAQSDRLYRFRLADGDTEMSVLSHVHAIEERMMEAQAKIKENEERQVHYLCMEFLIGRSLRNNAFNLGMQEALEGALADLGYEVADIFEVEDDPGLGNGGLGRLAACYMDSMATLGMAGNGYSIRYENGIFRQKIENGAQIEQPDTWLETGAAWQIPAMDDAREVRIGGAVKTRWEDGRLVVEHTDYTPQ